LIVVLDASPVGLLTHPKRSPSSLACYRWISRLVRRDIRVCLPEIIDYEIRREALLNNSAQGLVLLDRLPELVEYVPIRTLAMRRAAQLWAEARKRGLPTADRSALDTDVILAAEAQLLGEATGDAVVVATTNMGHPAQFVDARRWQDIQT
jgi:predicted nucleic acid-binding protein